MEYSGPYDLRPPIQPAKCGLKLKVVLKERDIYTIYKWCHWGIPSADGIPLRGCRLFFFFIVLFFPPGRVFFFSAAPSVAICGEENNGLG